MDSNACCRPPPPSFVSWLEKSLGRTRVLNCSYSHLTQGHVFEKDLPALGQVLSRTIALLIRWKFLEVHPCVLSSCYCARHQAFLVFSPCPAGGSRDVSGASGSLILNLFCNSGGNGCAGFNVGVPDSNRCPFTIFLLCCLGTIKRIHFQMQTAVSIFLCLCKTMLVGVHSLTTTRWVLPS